MIEVTSGDAKINGIGRIGAQPISLAAAALVIIVIGAGSIGLWRAYLGTSLKQDRIASIRLAQARTTLASEQLAERTKALEASQEESIDQLQVVQDQLKSLKRAVAAQQTDAKRLSDQIGDLSGAVDSLRQSFASAQAPEASSPRSTRNSSIRPKHHARHRTPAKSRR
jgi:threonine dehydrogenase-like Zn-dependent dehydrogenase